MQKNVFFDNFAFFKFNFLFFFFLFLHRRVRSAILFGVLFCFLIERSTLIVIILPHFQIAHAICRIVVFPLIIIVAMLESIIILIRTLLCHVLPILRVLGPEFIVILELENGYGNIIHCYIFNVVKCFVRHILLILLLLVI